MDADHLYGGPVITGTAVKLALAVIALSLVGVVVAMTLDLPAQFDTAAKPGDEVGAEAFMKGSAVSAPWPPLVALLLGIFFTTREGRLGVIPLVLFCLASLAMMIGVTGEFLSDVPFEGIDFAVFALFSVALFCLAIALLITTIRAFRERPTNDDL